MDGVQLPQGYSHFEEAVYFFPFSSQKSLVLILSTSEGWKAESTLEPPSGFEHRTPGLWIQHLNHLATGSLNMWQYGWICINRMWICLNMSEFTIIDRVLNMYHIIHSVRSLYKKKGSIGKQFGNFSLKYS